MQTLALATLALSFLFFACSNNDGNGIPPVCEPNSDEAAASSSVPKSGEPVDRDTYPQGPYWPETSLINNLSFDYLESDSIDLATLRQNETDRYLIIYSGSAWCSVCRQHMAQYESITSCRESQGVKALTIIQETTNGDSATAEYAETFRDTQGLTHPLVADSMGVFDPYIENVQRERPGAFRIAMLVDLDTMAILALGELPPVI